MEGQIVVVDLFGYINNKNFFIYINISIFAL